LSGCSGGGKSLAPAANQIPIPWSLVTVCQGNKYWGKTPFHVTEQFGFVPFFALTLSALSLHSDIFVHGKGMFEFIAVMSVVLKNCRKLCYKKSKCSSVVES
jgi:hypothetical protein